MTYQEIIQLFETICADHYQINEFSTSPLLTDLEVGTKGSQTPAVYPYVFLQPTPSRLEKGSMVYTFNMIVMNRVKRDQDKEVDQISDMIQIGQDIIAYFNLRVPRPDALIQLPVTVTPFVERFDGLVTGATFGINVQTPFALNMCIAPYKTPPPPPPPCINTLGLVNKFDPSPGDGTYISGGFGWMDWNGATVTVNTGTAPDGNNYKLYYKNDDSNLAIGATFQGGSTIDPGQEYNWFNISDNSFFGSIPSDDYLSYKIPEAGTSIDWTITYPDC